MAGHPPAALVKLRPAPLSVLYKAWEIGKSRLPFTPPSTPEGRCGDFSEHGSTRQDHVGEFSLALGKGTSSFGLIFLILEEEGNCTSCCLSLGFGFPHNSCSFWTLARVAFPLPTKPVVQVRARLMWEWAAPGTLSAFVS